MAGGRNTPDRWSRLLGPAERSAALLAESLRDPEASRPRRPRRRTTDRLIRLLRRVRGRVLG